MGKDMVRESISKMKNGKAVEFFVLVVEMIKSTGEVEISLMNYSRSD